MRKKYIKPIMDIELIEYQQTILAGSGEGYNTSGSSAGTGNGNDGPPIGSGGAGAPTLMDWSAEETEDL